MCRGIYVSDGTGTFRKLFPQSTGPVLRINSGVRGIEAALDVDGPYVASDDIQGIYRIAFAVQHQVGRVENQPKVVHSGVLNRPQQGDGSFLPRLVEEHLAVPLAVAGNLAHRLN